MNDQDVKTVNEFVNSIEKLLLSFFDMLSKSISQSEFRENATDNNKSQNSLKLFYNSQSLADLLEIDVRTLHKLRNKGRIGYIKHDGKYIYSREDVVKYIEDNHIDPLKT